ncbi:MAG TPA: SURF1 family protein [Ilumatobacteraceae bacterium]|jgi:cytochrome oxidase assembly protein ShyY1
MTADPAEPQAGGPRRYRFLVSPKWIAFHVLVVILVVAMVNLGFWQLRRLDHRRQFNANVRANANQPVASFDTVEPAFGNPSSVEWRRIQVTGTFDPDRQFEVVNRSQSSVPGRNIVDALRLTNGSLLLVNRGFLPQTDRAPAVPRGPVQIVGRLRQTERRGIGQTADASTGVLTQIRRIDIDVLSKQFDAPVAPMYIEQLESSPADDPSLEPIVAPTLDEGPHLSYAIQWFFFSLCAVVGWVLAVRRSIATRSGGTAARRASGYVPIADDEVLR